MPRSTYLEKQITNALDARLNQAENSITTLEALNVVELGNNVSTLTNDANYQTNADVDATINALIDAAPGTLDTLGELATALQENDSELAAIVAVNTDQNTAIAELETEIDLRVPRSVSTTDPTAADTDFVLGHEWENSNSGKVYKLIGSSPDTVVLGSVVPSSNPSPFTYTVSSGNSVTQLFSGSNDTVNRLRLLVKEVSATGSIDISIFNHVANSLETTSTYTFSAAATEAQVIDFLFPDIIFAAELQYRVEILVNGTSVELEVDQDIFPDPFRGANNARFTGGGEINGNINDIALDLGTATTATWVDLTEDGDRLTALESETHEALTLSRFPGGLDLSDGQILSLRFLDEDDLISNSDDRAPTQQSVKAYVDGLDESRINYSGQDFAAATVGDVLQEIGSRLDPLESEIHPQVSLGTATGGLALDQATQTLQLNLLDEDDLVSNSDSQTATQQSIKTYVDTEIAAVTTTSASTSAIRRLELPTATVALSNTDKKVQHIIIDQNITINLPTSPIAEKHFIIKNALSSTANLTIEGVILVPGDMWEGIYDGTEWVEL